MTACQACVAGGLPECCTEEHTPSVLRLAITIAQSLRNEDHELMEQASWYIEDAAAIASEVSEGGGWVIKDFEGGEFFWVNEVEFWLDMMSEGFNTPILASLHREWLAEDEMEEECDG